MSANESTKTETYTRRVSLPTVRCFTIELVAPIAISVTLAQRCLSVPRREAWTCLNIGGSPMSEIYGQLLGCHVQLRPFSQSDITDEYISWLNDPEVVRYSNQRFVNHTKETSLTYWESFLGSPNLFFSVRSLDGSMAFGTMTAYVSLAQGTTDLGILIGRKSLWGRGIGQDAWNTLVDFFLHTKRIPKVTAGTLSTNKGMIRIMERSGMVCESIQPKHELFEGKSVDLLYYAKYRV